MLSNDSLKLLSLGLSFILIIGFIPVVHASDKIIIFRDDDAQGYWLVNVFENVTNTLIQNDVSQTIGLIPFMSSSSLYSSEVAPKSGTLASANFQKATSARVSKVSSALKKASAISTVSSAPAGYISFGADADLKNYLDSIKSEPSVEIAIHGFVHSENEFQSLTYATAKTKIGQGIQDIYSEIGVTPVTFIAPYNTFNTNALKACKDSGMKRFSAAIYSDSNSWKESPSGLLHVPDTVEFYDWDTDTFQSASSIISECQASLDQYNACVMLIHPQEFANADYTAVDSSKYQTLISVLTWVKQQKSQGAKLMTIGQYGLNSSNATKKSNGQACVNGSECQSSSCSYGYCCNPGQCGWLNGSAGTCVSNASKATNITFNGICRSGAWKTVFGGIGCNSYQCDNGTCINNSCAASCQSQCSVNGQKQCSGSGYQTCGDYNGDSCKEWSAVTNCSAGQVCANGSCVSSCQNECLTNGTNQCSGKGVQTCGNYDSDSCLEWSMVTNCSGNQTCQNGSCISNPANLTNTTKTIQKKILAGKSDAYEKGTTMYPTGNILVVGKSGSTTYRSGYAFTGVEIPKGAIIISAKLKLPYNWRSGATANTILYGEAIDNSGQFTTTASNITKRQKTTASIAWNSLPSATWGNFITSPDISGIVREVTGRSGWKAGNSLTILHYEAANAASTWEGISYEGCKGGNCTAILEVQYIG